MAYGTWKQTGGGGGGDGKTLLIVVVAVTLFGGAGAAIVAFLTDLLLILGALVGVLLAAVVTVIVLAWRRGWRPTLNPVISWQPHVASPAHQAAPIAARPVRAALPAPQTVNYFNFYGVTPGQAAEVVEQQRRAIDER